MQLKVSIFFPSFHHSLFPFLPNYLAFCSEQKIKFKKNSERLEIQGSQRLAAVPSIEDLRKAVLLLG